ncbi:hypothetical protein SAMN06265367_101425 [Algoriphagus winogradskyi]|uniref:Uncharacterized protein n=1 Tax=Algoriphagus winogradskyi TaxID=237017 RepID=A0ABY1NCL0_9BACT|nr:hypothetical protein SAMN06265367_101425 [Algoriphagus winogradskyi]
MNAPHFTRWNDHLFGIYSLFKADVNYLNGGVAT